MGLKKRYAPGLLWGEIDEGRICEALSQRFELAIVRAFRERSWYLRFLELVHDILAKDRDLTQIFRSLQPEPHFLS